MPYPQAIVVTAAGNIVVLPMENDDDDTVTFTAAPCGFVPPFRVRRVTRPARRRRLRRSADAMATGTVMSLARNAHHGWVRPDFAKADAFFHGSELSDDDFNRIDIGSRLEFELVAMKKSGPIPSKQAAPGNKQ